MDLQVPCASPGCARVQSVYGLIEQKTPWIATRKSRSPSSSEQRHAVLSVGITVFDVYLEWEPGAVASLLLYQWTTQSSPPDGGRNALMPHPVWVGAYIVRRPVARRSFALKKLDYVAPVALFLSLSRIMNTIIGNKDARHRNNNRLYGGGFPSKCLDKFVVPGLNARSNVLQILPFPLPNCGTPILLFSIRIRVA